MLLCLLTPLPALADATSQLDLTLQDALDLALQNNRPLLNRRLDREVERFSLEVTEDRWTPRATIRPFASQDRQDRRTGVSSEINMRVPTGGQLSLRWDERLSRDFQDSRSQALSFTQPLLRGAWMNIEMAPIRQARLGEKVNILSFRQTLENLVVAVIGAYRGLIGSVRQVEIADTALLRAREQLQSTRALIRAGRVAAREAVRAEVTVANRELSLTQAQNRLDAANFRLLDILELGSTVRIQPLEKLQVPPTRPDFETVFEEALRKRADYLQAGIAIDAARINLALAKNNRLPDLSLGVQLNDSDPGRKDAQVQLNLSIPFRDRFRDVNYLRARNSLRKAERNQLELRETIDVAVRQVVNDVAVGLRLTELARAARELAQQNLDIEREKFSNGLSTSFEVSASEDDLVRAEQSEVDAIIAYLDVLIRLDFIAGRTLETWGIPVETLP
ncbi:MAG: TolC family protein [Gammaproteobacteria bacterium]|nr:TolC family protein [Gammaproteobacteria bacterium]MCY4281658.1 TolC family protein [Gammaproteobacteria bacterium]